MLLFVALGYLGSIAAGGCSDENVVGTAEQRNLGDIELDDGLAFSLQPGTIDQHTRESVEARASVPLPQFSLSTGAQAAQQIRVTLANIHRDAQIRVLTNTPLSETTMAGCPADTTREIVDCVSSPTHESCQPPALSREDGKRSEASLTIDVEPCTRRSFTVELATDEAQNSATQPMRMAVLGRAESLEELRRALEAATDDEPDFVVLLGDAVENSSLNGLRDLDFLLRSVDFPAVVLPGEVELVDDNRAQFLQVFGPFDFGWEVRGVHHYAFYSATAELGENGITRLRSVLKRMESSHQTLLFTHTPPTDPIGPRNQGFLSQIQAARVLSLISDSTVDAFFVGHINDGATVDLNAIKMYLTSVERTHEYLSVQVDEASVNVTRRSF